MYDSGKVITGLVIFIGFMTYPIWHGIGGATPVPELKKPLPVKGKECVEKTAYMRANHMQMLDEWRLEAVRDGKRIYVNEAGKNYNKSLQNTCMDCHETKKDFCDKCHTYTGVKPFCWTCHIEPKEKETK